MSTFPLTASLRVLALPLFLGAGFAGVGALTAATPALARPLASTTPDSSSTVESGWLGVVLARGGANDEGVTISRPLPGSPAEQAGIARGDVVRRVNGARVTSSRELIDAVGALPAGSIATLAVRSAEGAARDVQVLLSVRPDDATSLAERMVGRPAPLLYVRNASTNENEELLPSDGRVRIVDFWATWCGVCTRTMPALHDGLAHLPSDQFELVSVSGEDLGPVRRYANAHESTGRIVQSQGNAAANEFWVSSLPSYFLIDRAGQIRAFRSGGEGWRALVPLAEALLQEPRAE